MIKNELTTFTFNTQVMGGNARTDHNIRVVTIHGDPWFLGVEVCAILGIENASNAYARLDIGEKTNIRRTEVGLGHGRDVVLINESGLYKLVLRSDKPEAKVFQNWVTKVVLPAIRKDGAYVMGEEKVVTGEMSEDELVLKAVSILQAKVQRLAEEKALARRINEQQYMIVQHSKSMLEAARIAGEALIEAKKQLAHGQFKQWVEANTTVSYRQAAKYMQVAKCAPQGTFDPDMGINAFLERYAQERPKAPVANLPTFTEDDAEYALKIAARMDSEFEGEAVINRIGRSIRRH